MAKDGVIAGLADASTLLTQAFTAAKGAAPASVSTGDGYAIFQVQDVKRGACSGVCGVQVAYAG